MTEDYTYVDEGGPHCIACIFEECTGKDCGPRIRWAKACRADERHTTVLGCCLSEEQQPEEPTLDTGKSGYDLKSRPRQSEVFYEGEVLYADDE